VKSVKFIVQTKKINTLKIHPVLSNKDTLFYRRNKAVSVDFSASEISSDGSLILLEKIERNHKLIKNSQNICQVYAILN
jgi:hypothetical protein